MSQERSLLNHSNADYLDDLRQVWIERDAIDALKSLHPDPAIIKLFDARICQNTGTFPMCHIGQHIAVLAQTDDQRRRFLQQNGWNHIHSYVFVRTPLAEIHRYQQNFMGKDLAKNAATALHPDYSVRTLRTRLYFTTFLLLVALGQLFLPAGTMLSGLLILLCIAVIGNSWLRVWALVSRFKADQADQAAPRGRAYSKDAFLPRISLMVPLYRETAMLEPLVRNLEALHYPEDRIEIKLLLEEDDTAMIEAVSKIRLPGSFEIIIIPISYPRTKPKALNYALPFCMGEIIGIYDAEDQPDPFQLFGVVEKFRESDEKTACVQCELRFYNTDQNWLTRCFSIEYRIWFGVVLPAMRRLGVPVPLGGTSMFIYKDILEEVGAWDSYNVTEDADLGVRLARFGYKLAILDIETNEQANPRLTSWIRQRSRWLKGYLQTWLCHMRKPRELRNNIGWRGFFVLQTLFLGTVFNYISVPFYWLFWSEFLGLHPLHLESVSNSVLVFFSVVMGIAMAINLMVAYFALRAQPYRRLMPWFPTLFLYWPLGSVAAFKAVIEIFVAPYFWDKTDHRMPKSRKKNEQRDDSTQDQKKAA